MASKAAFAERLTRDVDAGSGWLAAESSTVVRAPAERCVDLVSDLAGYTRWHEYVSDVEVLDRDRRGRPLRVRIAGRIGDHGSVAVIRARYPSPSRFGWEQLEGELDAIRGHWAFRSLAGGRTRATVRLEIKPGWRLRLLLRGAVYEQLRDMVLDHMLDELTAAVE